MPDTKLVFLASMPHSGSTVTSLLLGTHPRMIGLGGIGRSVSMLSESPETASTLACTCGASASDCIFWGEIVRRLKGTGGPPRDWVERYQLALEVFGELFGHEAWPVDSTKHVEALRDLNDSRRFSLRAIHLIKDVRALTISFIDNHRRSKGGNRPGAFMAIEYFWKWRRRNRKISSYLEQARDLPSIRVTYEKLCFEPDAVMKDISALLEIDFAPLSLELAQSRSHLIVGNRMRREPGSQRLRYDYRWIFRNDWVPAAFLFPGIMRANAVLASPVQGAKMPPE